MGSAGSAVDGVRAVLVAAGVPIASWALRFAARQVDPQVLRDARPGDPHLLNRLVGDRTPRATAG